MPTASGRPRSGALDAMLGKRIRERRLALSLTQSELGSRIGMTFQQIQKYENGSNRITALTLVKLAKALESGVTDLLRDLESEAAAGGRDEQVDRLLTHFATIESWEAREAVLTIVERLGDR